MRTARRLDLGQWFTPPEVADLALTLALPQGQCLDLGRLRLLDPTCGDGVFLARAHARGVQRLWGIELDSAIAAAARAQVPQAQVQCSDLFAIDPAELACDPVDVVVGNPPYVRQERLDTRHKRRVRERLLADWPDVPAQEIDRVVGRGDLAVACILRALRLVRPGGRVALVVSSALLDADYAAALWRLVERCGRVVALVEAPRERWFADAAINAMILVVERTGSGSGRRPPVCTARLSVSTVEAARRLRDWRALGRVAELRWAPADQPKRWSACLRAADAWFRFEAEAGDALIPLGAVAKVRRGVTTGANEVFYLHRDQARNLGLERDLLWPLLRSPRQHTRIAVDPKATSHLVLVCPPAPDALASYPAVRAYVTAHKHVADRPTLRARRPWWALPVKPARLFLTKAYAARFVQPLANAPVVADQRVYAIHPTRGVDVSLLAAVLNTTFTAFAIESLGRSSMGEGALEWTVADAVELPILDPRRLAARSAQAARAALSACARRTIGDIGTEWSAPDRRRLDHTVSSGAPALKRLRDDLGRALVAAVKRRHERAHRPVLGASPSP